MDKAAKTMIENLEKNTGKSLNDWIKFVNSKGFVKHGEYMNYLKKEEGLTHGFANLIALKARKSDAGSAESTDILVETQYKGKEHFKLFYDSIIKKVSAFGSDVEVAPKKAYVSLRAKKQFAMLKPATKTRFEIGLNLKSQENEGPVFKIEKANAMFSHQINVMRDEELNEDIFSWLNKAYVLAK